MSDIFFPGIFFWYLFFVTFCLFCSFWGKREYGGRKVTDGMWWPFSSPAGSFLPITHLLMVAIPSRPSVHNIQDPVKETGYLQQLASSIWVSEYTLTKGWGGGSTSTLRFYIISCRPHGQHGSQQSLSVSAGPPARSLGRIQAPTASALCGCFPLAISHFLIHSLSIWRLHAENTAIPWNVSIFPCPCHVNWGPAGRPTFVMGPAKPLDHLATPTRSLSVLFGVVTLSFREFFLEAFFHDALGIHL